MDRDEEIYKSYMARCARIITENTARMSGGGYLNVEFDDIIDPPPKDTRSADEIVQDIITQAGIEVITQ